MQRINNIEIIGTSHIAQKSIYEIEREFFSFNPDIVAVELDRGRLHALLNNEKPSYSPRLIARIGLTGYVFALIGSLLQKRLGDLVGVSPGAEMLSACILARDYKRRLALIDQDVNITLRKLSKEFSAKEKLRMIIDVICSPFSKKLRIDLKGVPDKSVINELLGMLKARYPGIHKVLIEERNKIMAERVVGIAGQYTDQKLLVVVGAGHEDELAALVSDRMNTRFREKSI